MAIMVITKEAMPSIVLNNGKHNSTVYRFTKNVGNYITTLKCKLKTDSVLNNYKRQAIIYKNQCLFTKVCHYFSHIYQTTINMINVHDGFQTKANYSDL